jgi:hypothetical protein
MGRAEREVVAQGEAALRSVRTEGRDAVQSSAVHACCVQ